MGSVSHPSCVNHGVTRDLDGVSGVTRRSKGDEKEEKPTGTSSKDHFRGTLVTLLFSSDKSYRGSARGPQVTSADTGGLRLLGSHPSGARVRGGPTPDKIIVMSGVSKHPHITSIRVNSLLI